VLDIGSVFFLLVLGLWIFCIVDVLTTERTQVKVLPKWAWVLVILFLFPVAAIGPLLWLFVGRPVRPFSGARSTAAFGPVDGWSNRPPRPAPTRRVRPPTRAERAEEEADVHARIAERDRLLAKWAEEDQRKSAGTAESGLPAEPGAGPGPPPRG